MAELFAYLFFFVIGFMVGAGTFMTYGLHQVRKMKKTKQNLIEDLKKKAVEVEQKTNSIKERLTKAAKIAQAQQELRAQAEMPSKNGLHSKYKNGIVTEINELEQEKLDILRTILAEGYNPVITVLQEGGAKEDLPLSDYVATAQSAADAATGKKPDATEQPATTTPDPNAPRRVGKFFIYKGGKDDGKSH